MNYESLYEEIPWSDPSLSQSTDSDNVFNSHATGGPVGSSHTQEDVQEDIRLDRNRLTCVENSNKTTEQESPPSYYEAITQERY